ncbi:MAG: hypothetical protein K2X77_19585 [Candidatus Obscuribacterales bacterium]|jgi:hypothetical protein|nr:hypothetical protein [Candidatus Obscuribacterales bacterium]
MNQNLKTILLSLLAVVVVGLLFLKGCDGPTPNPTPNPNPSPTEPAPKPAGTGLGITTYADGKQVAKFDAKEYTSNPDSTAMDYTLNAPDANGSQSGHAEGAWVVEHRSWAPSGLTPRYRATLYSGNTAVGTWKVNNFSTDTRTVLLYPGDGTPVLRVSGTVVIETIAGTTGGAPTEQVTVTDGGKVVFTKDMAWTTRIKHYLQGQPANGAGVVYIWGDVTVESLKK